MADSLALLSLPPEVLVHIFSVLATEDFLRTVVTCKLLFALAAQSREALLGHLHQVPGLKLGLDSKSIPTLDLFRTLRQRGVVNLYGATTNADCHDLRLHTGAIDVTASCVTPQGYPSILLVQKHSPKIKLFDPEKMEFKNQVELAISGWQSRNHLSLTVWRVHERPLRVYTRMGSE